MPTQRRLRVDRIQVSAADSGVRLDRLLAGQLSISRAHARQLVDEGAVVLSERSPRADTRLREGDEVVVTWDGGELQATPHALPILHHDEELVVVDKPSGMPVHPTSRHARRLTVVTALLGTVPLAGGPPERPGVVHRLDAATSGVLVLACTVRAHGELSRQFRAREVEKVYLAVVSGCVEVSEGSISGRMARDPKRPWRMEVSPAGREAYTEFFVTSRSEDTTLLEVRPSTGRTHQIRVHLAAIGHPIMGDVLYGTEAERLMLHAWRLGFRHPASGEPMSFCAPPPPGFGADGRHFPREGSRS